jgi:hypothetical protein
MSTGDHSQKSGVNLDETQQLLLGPLTARTAGPYPETSSRL